MRKFFILLFPLFLFGKSALGQDTLNVNQLGRWGKGPSKAVFLRGGYTFVGNGAYLEVYKAHLGSYNRVSTKLMPGPVEDIWVRSDTTHVYVACGDEGVYVVTLSNGILGGIVAKRNTDGFASALMQFGGNSRFLFVADGRKGLAVVDMIDANNPRNLNVIGNILLPGFARDVWAISEDTVLVAADSAGLYSVDVSVKSDPDTLDVLTFEMPFAGADTLSSVTYSVQAVDTVAYVAVGWGGMRTVNIKDPANLKEMDLWTNSSPVEVRNVSIDQNKMAYLACGVHGLYVLIDVSVPDTIRDTVWERVDTDGFSSVVAVSNDTAYVGDGYGGHRLLDVSGTNQPAVIKSIPMADQTYDVDMDALGQYGYVAAGRSGLKIFNVNPSAPNFMNEIGSYNTLGEARGVTKGPGNFVYVADGSKGLHIVDVTNPSNPTSFQTYSPTGDTCYDVALSGNYAFLACGHSGLRIVDLREQPLREITGSPFDTPGNARSIKVTNNKAYLADSSGVYIYKITGLPNAITAVVPNDHMLSTALHSNLDVLSMDVMGDTVFVANGEYGFLLWTMSTNAIETHGTGSRCTDIAARGKTIYLTDMQDGLRIFDFSRPGIFDVAGYYGTGSQAKRLAIRNSKVCVADGEDGLYVLNSDIKPTMSISTDLLDFGPVLKGNSRPLILWIRNTGTTLLEGVLSVPSIYRDEFEFDDRFQIPPRDTLRLEITFTPQLNYDLWPPKIISATIITNDPDTPSRPITLQWLGARPVHEDPYLTDYFTYGLWHFNESAGNNTVQDNSGNSLNGQVYGNAAREPSKPNFGNAILFDGQNDWVRIPYNSLLNFSNLMFTIEFWFSMKTKPTSHAILLRRGNGDSLQYEIALDNETQMDQGVGVLGRIRGADGQTQTLFTGSMADLNINQWYHVAFTWDGDSLRLYLNSVLKDKKMYRKTLKDNQESPLAIGASSLLNVPFHGYIDEVRISRIARQPWEFHVNRSQLVLQNTLIDFSDVLKEQSRKLPVTLQNGGIDSLEIKSISIVPPSNLLTSTFSSKFYIQPGSEATMWLTFSPHAAVSLDQGSRLVIESSDPTFPSKSISLAGKGVTTLPTTAYVTDPFTLGLWHFDETVGNVIYDASGHQIHGTRYGADWTAGKFESSLVFDNPNDIVVVKSKADQPVRPEWGGFSVDAWFNISSSQQGKGIIARRGSGTQFQFDLYVDNTFAVVGKLYNTNQDTFRVSTAGIQANRWYHVGMSLAWDDTLRLYLDGERKAEKKFTGYLAGTHEDNSIDTLSILVGRDWEKAAPFTGKMDELRISTIGRQAWEFNANLARVAVSADTLDFGEVPVGKNRILKLWVKNSGLAELTVENKFFASPSHFSVDTVNFHVPPKDSVLVQVTYTPTSVGANTEQLSIKTNDPSWSNSYLPVVLRGIGMETESKDQYTSDLFTNALYHFNEGTGGNLGDASGEGKNGVLHGNPVWSDSGRYGKALTFDGVNDWVEIGNQPLASLIRSDFTVELWFLMFQKPTDYSILFRSGSSDTTQIELALNSKRGMLASIWDSGGGVKDTLASGSLASLNTNQWYHAALVWDGNHLRLYVNNELADEKQIAGDFIFDNKQFLAIGGSSTLGHYFYGMMDEMRISRIARTEWEFNVLPRQLELSPARLDFPPVPVGKSRILYFRVANLGDQDLLVNSVTGGGGVFTLTNGLTNFTLRRLHPQILSVKYTPTVKNATNRDTLTIVTSDTTVILPLVGESKESIEWVQYQNDTHTLALYHFNEAAGNAVNDSSNHRYHGALRNGVTRTDGLFKKGLFFDGVEGRVEVPSNPDLDFDMATESFTIECFFKTDTVSQALISRGFSDATHTINYRLSINSRGQIEVEGNEANGPMVSDNQWHHVAYTYNHVTDTSKVFIDGVQIWAKILSYEGMGSGTRPLIIGAAEKDTSTYGHHFYGYLDEVRISDIPRDNNDFSMEDSGIEILSIAPDPPQFGEDVTLRFRVPTELSDPTLYYREAGGLSVYRQKTGVQDPLDTTIYQFDFTASELFPDSAKNMRGMEYYIEAEQGSKIATYPPSLGSQRRSKGLIFRYEEKEEPSGVAFHHRRFRMFSIPFQLDADSVRNVLEDDLGTYDPYQWRLFWYHRVQEKWVDYVDISNDSLKDKAQYNIFHFAPTRAFMMITNLGKTFDIENFQTVPIDSIYRVSLEPGWNMIGSPFNFSIHWDDCTVSDTVTSLYYWNGENYEPGQAIMEPWQGYFVYNQDTLSTAILSIPPKQAETGIGKATIKKGILTDLDSDEWMFRISAESKTAKDPNNYAGVRRDAKTEWDVRDLPEPPPIGDFVTLYFDRRDWKHYPGIYTADIQNTGKAGYIWNFVIKTMLSKESVEICWTLYQNLPEGWEAYIFDLEDGVSVNLRKDKPFVYETGEQVPNLRSFKLVVGTKEFIESESEGIPLEPVAFFLFQNYPNPFNGNTTIDYSLPKRSDVEIVIYNAIGQKVRTFRKAAQNAGQDFVVWDGRDDFGRIVSSGIYVYRLKAKDRILTRKMVFLK